MQIEHKKNTAYYLAFPMVSSSSPESFATGISVTDTGYYKDGAGSWTSLSITDTVAEIGSTGVYEIDLTAAELNHDQVIIKMTGSGVADTAFLLDMRTKLVSDLNDVSTADVNAQCDTALTDYDAPTKAELDTGFAALNDPTAAAIRTEIDSNSTQLAAIVADSNELQTDWANGGRLDLILDARASQTSVDTVDGNVDAILVDTGTTIPAQITALNDASAADILTTQMTESYASDGAAPTLAQALFAIQQFLQERATSSTTVTVKKLDGSTSAMTFTLDDATTPTSITRAT